jgi:predicted O-methyltransferase YrrM
VIIEIKIFLRRVLGNYIYDFFKILKDKLIQFSNPRKQLYNLQKDLEYNEKVLSKFFGSYDKKKISEILVTNKLKYSSNELSWHYHLFTCFNNSPKNILEIGTLSGEFTNYLSNLYPESKIYSIDLYQDDKNFKNTYDRNTDDKLSKFIELRKNNLKNKNIIFKELDSFNLLNHFKDIEFDLVWIDGDHLNPQVTIDIFSTYNLLNKDGIMMCDDIIKDSYESSYVDNQSFKTLSSFQDKNLLSNNYILKRINKNNYKHKKFISISKKIN